MQTTLSKSIQVLFLFFLVIAGLYFAKPFLVPLVIAGILAMLFLPMCNWLERKGWGRGIAAMAAVFILLLMLAGVVFLIGWQANNLAQDMGKMQEYLGQMMTKIKSMISSKLGIPAQKQQEIIKAQQSGGSGSAGKMVMAVLGGLSGVLVNTILVLVYTFLLLHLRSHIRQFIIKISPQDAKQKNAKILRESAKVVRDYLGGLGKMIVLLWIMYGIGFSIVGVKNALFFAILCGLLEIIPFVGNIAGTSITLLMALSQGADARLLLGIVITYAVVQFLQTYVLEPLVVGAQVKINPLFTILVIVLGELIWGVAGMLVAIPVTAIAKIIFDNTDVLKPYGYLVGESKKS
jgi:predicted PurR-regulated permease PerM